MRVRNLSCAILVVSAAVLLPICLASTNAAAQATPLEIEITISPRTLSLDSVAACDVGVTVHADIPLADIDCATLELEGIPVVSTKADNRGNLVANFDRADIKAIVAPPSATLTFTGSKQDGTPIAGSDTIRVVD